MLKFVPLPAPASTMSTPRAANIFAISALYLFLTISFTYGEDNYATVQIIDQNASKPKVEKLTHLRFYWQDKVGGPDATSMTVVKSPSGEDLAFGYINMIDNALTTAPETDSKTIGRSQGLYAMAALNDYALLMNMNLVFTDGMYNGSTLTVVGRNQVSSKVREMPVVGGSGLFRFSRGYVLATTHSADPVTYDATVEYNVYVYTTEEVNRNDH